MHGLLAPALALLLACGGRPPFASSDELPAHHRVAFGDTLGKLSRTYGVPADQIAARNGIRNLDELQVDRLLVIPRPEPPAPGIASPAPSRPPSPSPRRRAPAAPVETAVCVTPDAPDGPAPEAAACFAPAPEAPPASPVASISEANRFHAVDAVLGRAEAELHAARFEESVVSAAYARGMLDGTSAHPNARERVVRAELLMATALLAQGLQEAARESLVRALAANPALELDPAQTPQKLRHVFEQVKRAERTAPGTRAAP